MGVNNYSGYRYLYTCRVTTKTRLNPYASRLAEILQCATDSRDVRYETVPALRSKPYEIRLQGGSAGDTKLFHVSAGNGHADTHFEPRSMDASGSVGRQRSGRTDGADAALHGLCCGGFTESPDLLPGRRHVAGEVLPDSGKSGQAAVNVKAEGKHPSEKPLLTLTLTEEQFGHLAFAVLCQVGDLQESHESDNPEVVAAIRCLDDISRYCNEIKKGALS